MGCIFSNTVHGMIAQLFIMQRMTVKNSRALEEGGLTHGKDSTMLMETRQSNISSFALLHGIY